MARKEAENMDVEKLMDALDSVTWYNGLIPLQNGKRLELPHHPTIMVAVMFKNVNSYK